MPDGSQAVGIKDKKIRSERLATRTDGSNCKGDEPFPTRNNDQVTIKIRLVPQWVSRSCTVLVAQDPAVTLRQYRVLQMLMLYPCSCYITGFVVTSYVTYALVDECGHVWRQWKEHVDSMPTYLFARLMVGASQSRKVRSEPAPRVLVALLLQNQLLHCRQSQRRRPSRHKWLRRRDCGCSAGPGPTEVPSWAS